MNQHTLLYKHQHGFRPGHSCDTQLLNTITDFIENFDNNVPLDIIVLDFSKAFDVVSHTKLIRQLPSLGIQTPSIGLHHGSMIETLLLVNGARSSPVR